MKQEFSVGGMKCVGCVESVKSAVFKIEGVEGVEVSLDSGALHIVSREELRRESVEKSILQAGFKLN